MIIRPITLRLANAFVREHHRHCKVAQGCKFNLAAIGDDGEILGVVIVGRPIARHNDDGITGEITRLCAKSGAPKGTCSMLYARARRVWQLMGGEKMLTTTLASESGASLRGAGYKIVGIRKAHAGWSRLSRKREPLITDGMDKITWEG